MGIKVNKRTIVKELEFEIEMRKQVYGTKVAKRKMTSIEAKNKIALIQAAIKVIEDRMTATDLIEI